jgi:hypothetical protein
MRRPEPREQRLIDVVERGLATRIIAEIDELNHARLSQQLSQLHHFVIPGGEFRLERRDSRFSLPLGALQFGEFPLNGLNRVTIPLHLGARLPLSVTKKWPRKGLQQRGDEIPVKSRFVSQNANLHGRIR